VHAAVILGVGFVSLTRAAPAPANLDVILVHTPEDDAPDEADYLSTRNHAGGGTRDEQVRPTSPFKGTEQVDTNGVAPTPQRASSPSDPQPANDVLLTQLFSDYTAPRTRESDAAAYMHEWVKRVERIGNLNYPAAARARRLSGQLLMTVGIRRNGAIESVDIRRTSGLPALDQAATDIVRMAAPFDPLNEGLKARTDILYITRTWEFSSDNTLSSDR